MPTTSCIIPFYNEGGRILHVLNTLRNVKSISEIICVDDGSTDHTSEDIRQQFPNVTMIRLAYNAGKTAAIQHGLTLCRGENILFLDGDLQDLKSTQLVHTINTFENRTDVDMIILRRTDDPYHIIRTDIVISGQRLLRKPDILHITKNLSKRSQIELAIDEYMIVHKKSVRWMPITYHDTYKKDKYGFWAGTLREFRMYKELLFYKNPFWYIWLLCTFCWSPVEIS